MIGLYAKSSMAYIKGALRFDENTAWRLSLAFVLAVIVLSMPADVWAEDKISQVVCSIVGQLQGPVARGVAAFGIIFLGFSLFLGKISWGVALALGIGIGAIFGAKEIVGLIGGEGDACQ